MYKILIVDDEPLVRIAIKSLVDWEMEGFDLHLEAAQGREALEMLQSNQEIHMIVTDINMPIMNGIELLKVLQEVGSTVPVVVLSGYNDYNLVRQAFKLGAKDYILKSEMTPESLLKLFQNTVALQEPKENAIDTSISMMEKELLKRNYLRSLLWGEENSEQLVKPKDVTIEIEEDDKVVCQLLIDDYYAMVSKYEDHSLVSFMNTVINFIREVIKYKGEVINLSPDEYVVILGFKEKNQDVIRKELTETLNMIRQVLKNYMNMGITIGVSDVAKDMGKLKGLYHQARAKAQLRFLVGKGKNIFPETGTGNAIIQTMGYHSREKDIEEALRNKEPEKLHQIINQSLESIQKLHIENIKQSYPYYMQLIFVISKCIDEVDDYKEEISLNELEIYEQIMSFETLQEINAYIYNVMNQLMENICMLQQENYSRSIIKAIRYIRKNYTHKELNLKEVSEEVELSIGYFSALFAKEVQVSFKDFMTQVRIERAKQLILNSNLKIYEICDEVGYANVEHFSRVFKKVTGQSPNHFNKNKDI